MSQICDCCEEGYRVSDELWESWDVRTRVNLHLPIRPCEKCGKRATWHLRDHNGSAYSDLHNFEGTGILRCDECATLPP